MEAPELNPALVAAQISDEIDTFKACKLVSVENHNAKDCRKERVWNLETNVSTHFSKGLWEEAGSNTKTTLQHILEQFHKVLESLKANEKSKP